MWTLLHPDISIRVPACCEIPNSTLPFPFEVHFLLGSVMSVPDREVDVNCIFRALTVGVCDFQAKCPHLMSNELA